MIVHELQHLRELPKKRQFYYFVAKSADVALNEYLKAHPGPRPVECWQYRGMWYFPAEAPRA